MALRTFDDLDARLWVFLSFDQVEDGPEGEKRGRLSISFIHSPNAYVHFALHPIECWPRVLTSFNVCSEELSDSQLQEARKMNMQADERVATGVMSGYRFLSWSDQRNLPRDDCSEWLKSYDAILETLKGFSKRITFPEIHQVRFRNEFPYPFTGSPASTVEHTPLVQITATVTDWQKLHYRVQSMPDMTEMAPSFVNDSLSQVTEGMVRIFGDDPNRLFNDAICPYRLERPNVFGRILPRWVYNICELDDME